MPIAKLAAYYVVLGLFLTALVVAIPDIGAKLPFGGVEGPDLGAMELVTGRAATMNWEPVNKSLGLFASLMSVVLVMLPVAWVYMGVRRRRGKEQSFLLAILLLPLAVAAIVLIVQNSLALAFSLAGIVAGVRFRLTLDDTIDAIYVFVAIGVGLAAGISAVEIALVLSIFFNLIMLSLWYLDFGESVTGNRWFTRTWMARTKDGESDEVA